MWNSRKVLPFRKKVPTNHINVKDIYSNCFEMSAKLDSSLLGLMTLLMLFATIKPLSPIYRGDNGSKVDTKSFAAC